MFVASFVVACGPVRSLGHFCPFLHIPPAIVQRRAKGRNARQVSGLSERWSMRDLVSSSPMPALCLSASCLSSLGKTLRFQFRGDFLPFFVLFKAAVTFVLKNRRPLRAEARGRATQTLFRLQWHCARSTRAYCRYLHSCRESYPHGPHQVELPSSQEGKNFVQPRCVSPSVGIRRANCITIAPG
jgi:hypothetical protein